MAQGFPASGQEARHNTPRCQACGYVGAWNEEPLLLPHHIIITLILLFAFLGGLLYLLIILVIRSSSPRAKICPNCGSRNMFTFLYPEGTPDVSAGQQYVPQQAFAPAAPGGAVAATRYARSVRVLLNSRPLTSIPLAAGARYSVGRSASSGVVVNDSLVSGSHAVFLVHSNGDLGIADSGSTNGTFVNGVQITTEHRPLRGGDEVLLGGSNCRLTFDFA
ncbi:MAG: FHA domain-containing protein [Coriobacteriia bacterium]